MKIIFDSAFDGRAWPVWPYRERGCVGEIRLGRLGLLGYLEGLLGLRGPEMPEPVRIVSLIPSLQGDVVRFWSKSITADPFGVARSIIHLHDFLILHGWQGERGSARLADLAAISGYILPGVAQRLRVLCKALDEFEGDLPDLELVERRDALPPLWQFLFAMLHKLGAKVQFSTLQSGDGQESDLGKARKGKFGASQDGSLQLVRPDGMLQAAEEVAAWLAALKDKEGLEDVVIIGGDAVLDNALHRYGLPVVGAEPQSGTILLQLLPLTLAMGYNPPEPERIMELLTLPMSPVPRRISRKLREALADWPALGSELWNEKLRKGLQSIEDDDRRSRVGDRLDLLFSQIAGACYTVAEVVARVDMLLRWLRGRLQDEPTASAAITQCSLFKTMLSLLRTETIDEPLLQKLLDTATSEQRVAPSLSAQAGLGAVPSPEAVAGKVGRAIWWNFSRNSVSSLNLPLFSKEESLILAKAGVRLPDSALLADNRAERWRRPLDCAETSLLLICPKHDLQGEELHPHPLWDELLAASNDKAKELINEQIVGDVSPAVAEASLAPLPGPELVWNVAPGLVEPRDVESPSSLEDFLGCPLKWCLRYCADIRGSHATVLPDMVPLLGKLAHAFLAEILALEPLPTPAEGGKRAASLFEEKAPRMAAALFQKGMEVERERIRRTVVDATCVLLQQLHEAGVRKVSPEQELKGSFDSQKLTGFADLVVESPFGVIDMKRSWARGYKKKMESGTALQLALYALMLKELQGVYPSLAYYTLEDQTFLTSDLHSFPRGEKVEMPNVDEIIEIFQKTFDNAWKIVKSGRLDCPGNGEEVTSRVEVEEEQLILEPPCRFCDYDVLCGRRFQQ